VPVRLTASPSQDADRTHPRLAGAGSSRPWNASLKNSARWSREGHARAGAPPFATSDGVSSLGTDGEDVTRQARTTARAGRLLIVQTGNDRLAGHGDVSVLRLRPAGQAADVHQFVRNMSRVRAQRQERCGTRSPRAHSPRRLVHEPRSFNGSCNILGLSMSVLSRRPSRDRRLRGSSDGIRTPESAPPRSGKEEGS